jgi:hypothetical protein
MRRIFILCTLSVGIYAVVFGLLVDRPLSLGLLRFEILQKTTRLAALYSPKLVILAGSNGPYSHSCVVIGAMLNMPCENAGIAVGIGLDDIFARYAPLLHRGDIVYMPMELQQYTVTQAQYRSSTDGEFLFRHDRRVLAELPAGRILGAVFCCDLSDFLESLAEMPMAHSSAISPDRLLTAEYNAEGDRIDNDLTDAAPALLNHPPRPMPNAQEIMSGYGAFLIARFVAKETSHGITVIGGLPSDFATASLSPETTSALASVYTDHGGIFMVLPNRSLYPVQDFFNSEDHLARPCQYLHSIAVANHLAPLLNHPVQPPGLAVTRFAQTCPSAEQLIR